MKIQKSVAVFIVLFVFVVVPFRGFAQITSFARKVVPTEYSAGPQDEIHVFCGMKGETNASLTATSLNGETATFEWQKYNSGNFDFFRSESGNSTSTIADLQDGCYRVDITSASGVKNTYTAWVFNNYLQASAEITDSDCDLFKLKGNVTSPMVLNYVDLSNGQPKVMNKDIQAKWMKGNVAVSSFINATVFDPPTEDTNYRLELSDKFDCDFDTVVRYISIVTKASFDYKLEDPKSHSSKIEAPLTVTFTNTSENGDPGKFEWFIYRDRDEIVKEAAANPGKVIDSIMSKNYSDSPIIVFERPGSYKVKLVSQKRSTEFNTFCFDTVYIDKNIEIDTSFIEAPNVFTPNNDGNNDRFVVRFFSMKTVKFSIFNRWGKLLHVWESNNVQGFGPTVESVPQAVWDGKVGGKIATPGVYYYVVEGTGRDDKRQRASGFFHLFRDK